MPSQTTLKHLTSHFENLTDPRCKRTRSHELLNILVLTLCATLGGANSIASVERFCLGKRDLFGRFLDLPNGIPSHDTFSRVFRLVDPGALLTCVQAWLAALCDLLEGEVVAIDGKTLRGSFDKATTRNPLHLVSAWATSARLMLGQVAVDTKSNEITAIPALLELLDLKGCVVTIDAMGCQKQIAADIREKEADYVLGLKDNQPTAHDIVQAAFIDHANNDFEDLTLRRMKTVERRHGRNESREYFIAEAPHSLTQLKEWADLRSIGMVWRIREVNGAMSEEIVYYLSSLAPKVKTFARAVRGHWGIENTLHWCLDVTFAEDKSRIRKDNGPANLAVLRRLAISLLQQDTSVKDNIKGKRERAGWDEDALEKILLGFCRE